MASLVITLYQSCKLNNRFYQAFYSKATLNTYLATLDKLQVYSGGEVYFTNAGSISIDGSGLTNYTASSYNYMSFYDGLNYRYAFINDIQIVNEMAVISYSEDIWHSYAITSSGLNFSVKDSLLVQTNTLGNSTDYTATQIASFPKLLPADYEAVASPDFYFEEDTYPDDECYILITASVYKLNAQDKISNRGINNYLLSYKQSATDGHTPANTAITYLFPIDNNTLNYVNNLVNIASTQNITYLGNANWNYEILSIKIIPETIGNDMFTPVLSSDSLHDAGLGQDFHIDDHRYDMANDNTIQLFDCEYGFNNLCLQDYFKYTAIVDGQVVVRWTKNGYDPVDEIKYTNTIPFTTNDKIIGLGNYSRFIPVIYNGHDVEYKIELNLNVVNCTLTLFVNNQLYDISEDFEYHIPFTIQTADIMQQAHTNKELASMTALMGITSTAINTTNSIQGNVRSIGTAETSGDMAGAGFSAFGNAVNGVYGMLQSKWKYDQINQKAFVSNKAVRVSDIALKNASVWGLHAIECNPSNDVYVQKVISKYGYIYSILIDDISIIYSANNYIRFDYANVYGEFTQNIARDIETILKQGTRLVDA